MKIGVFGGTFNPPHIAHLILADEASHQLALGRVLWVLTPDPPHKSDKIILPISDRLDMVAAAIQDNPFFEYSRVDLDRPAPQYAVETMRLLGNVYPQDELVYLMGGDSLHDLPSWHNPAEFLTLCAFLGVMRRPGYEIDLKILEGLFPGIIDKIKFVDTPLFGISGTELRRRVALDEPFRYYLPPAVYKIILDRKLYRKNSS